MLDQLSAKGGAQCSSQADGSRERALHKIGAASASHSIGDDKYGDNPGGSAYKAALRKDRDQDKAAEAWPERGLLDTQLGPNKNGRKR